MSNGKQFASTVYRCRLFNIAYHMCCALSSRCSSVKNWVPSAIHFTSMGQGVNSCNRGIVNTGLLNPVKYKTSLWLCWLNTFTFRSYHMNATQWHYNAACLVNCSCPLYRLWFTRADNYCTEYLKCYNSLIRVMTETIRSKLCKEYLIKLDL